MSKLVFTKPNAYSGVFIKDCDATGIVVSAPDISWVDIHNAPNLRSITFKTSEDVHLSMTQCPQLSHISLPRTAKGAVLHLDLGANAMSLAITGTIRSIDTCSAVHHPTMASLPGQVFDGALVLHNRPTPQSYSGLERRELVIVQGLHAQIKSDFFAKLLNVKGLIVTDSYVEEISLPSGRVAFMHLRGLSKLQEIELGSQVCLAEFDSCYRLGVIHGSGRLLRMRNSLVEKITVNGFWDRGQFDDVQAHLTAPGIATTIGRSCRHILPTSLDVSNATNPLALLPCPEAIKDPHWQGLLLNWVNITELRSSALAGLMILKGLLDAGADAIEIKKSRRKLLCNLARKKAPHWEWPQTDLEMEIYAADLELLSALYHAGAVHYDEFETLLQIRTLAQIIAITRTVRKGTTPDLEAKFAAIILAFSHLIVKPQKGQSPVTSPITLLREIGFLPTALEYLIALRERESFRPILLVLPMLILKLFGDEAALAGIASLSRYGLQSARRLLVQRAQKLRIQKHKMAPRYLSAAMAPPKYALLSGI